jgi:hypothetical protein
MSDVVDQDLGTQGYEAGTTISGIVQRMSELGIVPYQVCNGVGHESLMIDALWKPHIGIAAESEEECHYLFTIAAMAGWSAAYDLDGRGLLLRYAANDSDGTIGAWALLYNAACLVLGEISRT